jgi:hypothetical protein
MTKPAWAIVFCSRNPAPDPDCSVFGDGLQGLPAPSRTRCRRYRRRSVWYPSSRFLLHAPKVDGNLTCQRVLSRVPKRTPIQRVSRRRAAADLQSNWPESRTLIEIETWSRWRHRRDIDRAAPSLSNARSHQDGLVLVAKASTTFVELRRGSCAWQRMGWELHCRGLRVPGPRAPRLDSGVILSRCLQTSAALHFW